MIWRCTECDWIGPNDSMLTSWNPFCPSEQIHGCPHCKAIDKFQRLCDEPDCKRDATCGVPTADGYRQICGKHYTEYLEKCR